MRELTRILIFAFALLASLWAKAGEKPPVKLPEKTPIERFSWVETDFVRKGYRTAPWIHDPFYPSERKFSLSAIIAPDRAYINGRWLRKGEEIDGYRVKEINTITVVLTRRSEIVQLKIKE